MIRYSSSYALSNHDDGVQVLIVQGPHLLDTMLEHIFNSITKIQTYIFLSKVAT